MRALIPGLFLLATSLGTFLVDERLASAHARLVDPRPRNNSTQYKNETLPCGGQPARAPTQPVTMLQAGSSIMVRFEETVDHPGCFLIDFSASGDTNWQELANVKHVGTPPDPSDQRPRPYMRQVTLPNTPCTACTIRVRQVMMETRGGESAACPPMPLGNTPTYFSCANVVLTGAGTPDAGMDARAGDAMGTGGMGGSTGGSGGSGGSTGGSGGSSGGAGGNSGSTGGSGGAGGSTSGSGGSTGGAGGSTGGSGGSTGGAGGSTGGSGTGSGGAGTSRGGSSGSGSGGSGTTNRPSVGCSVGGDQPPVAVLGFAALMLAMGLRGRRRR